MANAPGIYDRASERNRRLAWARYFAQRENTVQLAWWAAEIAEWLLQTADEPLDPHVLELIDLVRDSLPAGAVEVVERFVKQQRLGSIVA